MLAWGGVRVKGKALQCGPTPSIRHAKLKCRLGDVQKLLVTGLSCQTVAEGRVGDLLLVTANDVAGRVRLSAARPDQWQLGCQPASACWTRLLLEGAVCRPQPAQSARSHFQLL